MEQRVGNARAFKGVLRGADSATESLMKGMPAEIADAISLPRRLAQSVFDDFKYLVRVIISAIDRFYWDNGFSKAASLAYSTLFALVPLTALFVGFVGSFSGMAANAPDLGDFIVRQFLPNTVGVGEVVRKVKEFSQVVASLNVVTVPFIVITSLLLISSVEYALNQVWQVFESRPISHRIGIYCAILVLAPILALSAYYTAKYRVEPFLLDVSGQGDFINRLYDGAVPFIIDLVAFILLYYLVPKAPVQFRSAVFGGVFAALLFGSAKAAFAFYIRGFSSYERIYGTLAAIPIFLFWLYLAWTIVLFGCELSYQVQYLPRRGQLWKRQLLSVGDGRFLLAVQALVMVGRAFERGERLPNDLELAERLGCSSLVLRPALESLRSAGIISRGDSRDMPLTLARTPDLIKMEEVRAAVAPFRDSVAFADEVATVLSGEGEQLTLRRLIRGDLGESGKNSSEEATGV